jgi:hypothetical protein
MNNHAKAEDRTKAVMNAIIDKICLLVIAKSIMTQIRGKRKIFFKENVKSAKISAKVIFDATARHNL